MKFNNSFIIPLSVGGGAALFSLATGFISGVGTAQILVRGIFSAMLAAAFILLSAWLIRSFLPELTNLSSEDEEEPDELPAEGSRVNIVMGDDMPSPGAAQSAGLAGDGGGMPPGSDDAAGQENKIAENSETVHNNKLEESDPDRGVSPGNLDVLPDLDSLEISVGGVSGGAESGDTDDTVDAVTPSASAASAQPVSGEYGDPEDIAKAIKTVVARDQQK